MRNYFYVVIFSFLIAYTGCSGLIRTTSHIETFLVPAEDPIPGVPPEVNFADYWIRKTPNPDDIILTFEEIEKFNSENPVKGEFLIDITGMPEMIDGGSFREYIVKYASYLNDANFFVTGEIKLEKAERSRVIALMDTAGVPDVITLRFGVILHLTMGKTWPTTIPLMNSEGDNEFDQGVVSALDLATPVALIHTSKDGLWSLVQTPRFLCWIPSSAVAFGDIETVREFVDSSPPLVAIGHSVSVYGTPDEKAAIGSIQMGSHIPLKTAGRDFCEVLVPGRGKNGELTVHVGYVRRSSDVSIGYLPYTFRNVYRQCYVLFGRRYGWGGMYEERDCSGYIMDVFRCFNIQLPRNSTSQAKAAKAVISLEGMERETRFELLKSMPGGISLLQMPGHIMIYIGEIDGTPYAIHDFWAWRTPSGEGPDIVHRAARVAVTDMMLGEGSERGSFLDRLTYITILGNYEIQNQQNEKSEKK